MNVEFHPQAEEEFVGAVDYYEAREVNLGLAFAREIRATVLRILERPSAWPIVETGIRRCLARRFPYSILYAIDGETLMVLAVILNPAVEWD